MKKFGALLTILAWLATVLLEGSVLFVLYDAGETNGLIPVMQSLETQRCDFGILAMGTARDELQRLNLFSNKIIDLGVTHKVDRILWQRRQALSAEDLAVLEQSISARLVLTGVASIAQQQIAATLKKKGGRVIAFYDNMMFPLFRHPYRDVIAPFQDIANIMLVPSKSIAASISSPTAVVGQPSLDTWTQKLSTINGDAIRCSLGFINKPLMVYCGGYEGSYPEAFTLFAECLQSLDAWQVAVQLHPKVDGQMEEAILKNKGIEGVRIFKDQPGTLALIAAADLVICQHSTTGAQALLAGKQVLHVDLPNSSFTYFGIEAGLTEVVSNPTAFRVAINRARNTCPKEPIALYQAAGIPKDSVKKILEVIDSAY